VPKNETTPEILERLHDEERIERLKQEERAGRNGESGPFTGFDGGSVLFRVPLT
jgi:hypothetical protein